MSEDSPTEMIKENPKDRPTFQNDQNMQDLKFNENEDEDDQQEIDSDVEDLFQDALGEI